MITFMSVAAAVFFFVVVPVDRVQARRRQGAEPDIKECPECTTAIPAKARRCPQCTAQLVA